MKKGLIVLVLIALIATPALFAKKFDGQQFFMELELSSLIELGFDFDGESTAAEAHDAVTFGLNNTNKGSFKFYIFEGDPEMGTEGFAPYGSLSFKGHSDTDLGANSASLKNFDAKLILSDFFFIDIDGGSAVGFTNGSASFPKSWSQIYEADIAKLSSSFEINYAVGSVDQIVKPSNDFLSVTYAPIGMVGFGYDGDLVRGNLKVGTGNTWEAPADEQWYALGLDFGTGFLIESDLNLKVNGGIMITTVSQQAIDAGAQASEFDMAFGLAATYNYAVMEGWNLNGSLGYDFERDTNELSDSKMEIAGAIIFGPGPIKEWDVDAAYASWHIQGYTDNQTQGKLVVDAGGFVLSGANVSANLLLDPTSTADNPQMNVHVGYGDHTSNRFGIVPNLYFQGYVSALDALNQESRTFQFFAASAYHYSQEMVGTVTPYLSAVAAFDENNVDPEGFYYFTFTFGAEWSKYDNTTISVKYSPANLLRTDADSLAADSVYFGELVFGLEIEY